MAGKFIQEGVYQSNIAARHRRGVRMRIFYQGALLIAIIALLALLYNISNRAFGLVALRYEEEPDSLSGRTFVIEGTPGAEFEPADLEGRFYNAQRGVASVSYENDALRVSLEALDSNLVLQQSPEQLIFTVGTGDFEGQSVTFGLNEAGEVTGFDLDGQTFDYRVPYGDLSSEQLAAVLAEQVPRRMLVLVRDSLRGVEETVFTRVRLDEAIDGDLPESIADRVVVAELDSEQRSALLDALGQARDDSEAVTALSTDINAQFSLPQRIVVSDLLAVTIDAGALPEGWQATLAERATAESELRGSDVSFSDGEVALIETALTETITVLARWETLIPADLGLEDFQEDSFRTVLGTVLTTGRIPSDWDEALSVYLRITDLTPEEMSLILAENLSEGEMRDLVDQEILQPVTLASWDLRDSLLHRGDIDATVEDRYPDAELTWRSWVGLDFLTSALSTTPADAGVRPALLGSLWLMLITFFVSVPLGVGAAIYLQEYASDTWLNRVIEINIRNLAGVPSIIYGMLGLAIFVRALVNITDGRTILSAGLTLALLVLPVIIINAQEALRAVPSAIREASYGLGATRGQTISRQVLPAAIPGIMTGTILSMSRAVGETAPLIVVGAAAFITVDPNGPLSRFTALPILVYDWTKQPDPQFRNIAAAAILVLLILLLSMNSIAIYLRNRASNRRP